MCQGWGRLYCGDCGLCRQICCGLAVISMTVDIFFMSDKCCSIVRVMCFWCEEGLGMYDFRVYGLVMTGFVLVAVLSANEGLGMAGFTLAAHGLCVRVRDGLGMCDFFLTVCMLGCCGMTVL